MKLRTVIVAILILGLIAALSYKVYEGLSLNKIGVVYNENILEELEAIESSENDNEAKSVMDLTIKLHIDDYKSLQEGVDLVDEIKQANRKSLDSQEAYIKLVTENRDLISSENYFLFGKASKKYELLKKYLLEYYDQEIQSARHNLAMEHQLEILNEVKKDALKFTMNVEYYTDEKDNVNYEGLYSSFAYLEKYTKQDHKFKNEDEIRSLFPKTYDYLTKQREFFKIYYLLTKDVSNGDQESAAYKYERSRKVNADLNPDMESILFEGGDDWVENLKKTIENVADRVLLVKEIELLTMKNPFVGKSLDWEEDVEICQLYTLKTVVFQDIVGKDPESRTVDELLKELESISPKTTKMDGVFNKSRLDYSNNEESLEFICHANNNETKFTFYVEKEYGPEPKLDASLGTETVDSKVDYGIVVKVGKLISLPQDEEPSIATVTDKQKLADQTFFKNSENGDKVLIYEKANKAILYRPSTDKVIDITTINEK